MPFYVSPEQQMKDKADFARKGIARGRSVVVIQYADGILLVSENPSQALHKISEIYDRIAFAAVGRYNEFENLRIAGVRLADLRGYSYDRHDVTGRGLANAYAQTLGSIFSAGMEKPYEVELFVAEVNEDDPKDDQIYRLTYDGSVADEQGFAVMGGDAEKASAYLRERYQPGVSLEEALRLAVAALGQQSEPPRELSADQLEVAVLDRTRAQQRKFKRIREEQLADLFGSGTPAAAGRSVRADPPPAAKVEPSATEPPGEPTPPVASEEPPATDQPAQGKDELPEIEDPASG
jgi:proteasome alpha subunit